MGFGGISIWQLLIILVIVLLLFGTKKLRNMGGDLGEAIKNFRKSVKDPESPGDDPTAKPGTDDASQRREGVELPTGNANQNPQGRVIDAEATAKSPSDSGSRQI